MVQLKPLKLTSKEYEEMSLLYENSFPSNERRSFKTIIENRSGVFEVYSIFDETEVVGFIAMINHDTICHIIYFAIDPSLQNKGYGSNALSILHAMKKDMIIIADLEDINSISMNQKQRIQRMNFYKLNGYQESEVKYRWQEEDYVVLAYNGTINNESFWGFWDAVMPLIEPDKN